MGESASRRLQRLRSNTTARSRRPTLKSLCSSRRAGSKGTSCSFFLTLSRAQGEEEGKDNRNSAAAATACRRCFCGHATAAWRQCASQENGYVETAPVLVGAALCESPCWQRQGTASGPLPLRSFGASRVGSHVCSRAQHELFKLDSTQSVVTAFLCSNSFRIDSELFKLDSTQPVVAALLCPKLLGDFASAYDFV